jgi:hypothetical protein
MTGDDLRHHQRGEITRRRGQSASELSAPVARLKEAAMPWIGRATADCRDRTWQPNSDACLAEQLACLCAIHRLDEPMDTSQTCPNT